ncbi:MAG: DUF6722 family protein [Parabacteroides gordonii]|uniref:DUF6722 family protein n=1 Tax=Parabacteroides gordonii TaxID=574930 RepID=UPI003A838624
MKNRRKTRTMSVPLQVQSVKKEDASILKELGKYLLDISKLVVGGAVITTVLQLNTDKILVITIAVSIAILLCIAGFLVLTYKKK